MNGMWGSKRVPFRASGHHLVCFSSYCSVVECVQNLFSHKGNALCVENDHNLICLFDLTQLHLFFSD